jgi:hypothetical protein
LTVVDLFTYPTVRDLALLITRQRQAGTEAAPVIPSVPSRADAAARRRAARAFAGEVAT